MPNCAQIASAVHSDCAVTSFQCSEFNPRTGRPHIVLVQYSDLHYDIGKSWEMCQLYGDLTANCWQVTLVADDTAGTWSRVLNRIIEEEVLFPDVFWPLTGFAKLNLFDRNNNQSTEFTANSGTSSRRTRKWY